MTGGQRTGLGSAGGTQLIKTPQALDKGADPVTVRAEVDETVRTIAAALREKAKQVG